MTKEKIVEAIANNKMLPYINPDFLSGIVDFVLDNYQPSLPSNLDGAADEYGHGIFLDGDCSCIGVTDAFKAGAEWMAEQGISVEGDTDNGLSDEYDIRLEDYLNSLPKGTKLVLQIRKK